jgi:FtsZ-binding cell division protein ZapB
MGITLEGIEESPREGDLEVVETLIEKVRSSVSKVTCGDLARLLQLRIDLLKEEEREKTREIIVTWNADPTEGE